MNNQKISGERLFLLYAYPCAEIRERRGLISLDDVRELDRLIDSEEDPSHELIQRCFPMAFETYSKFAGISPLAMSPWLVGKVREFWRAHNGRTPECAVMLGVVVALYYISVKVRVKRKSETVFNRYKLQIDVRDEVYFHRHVIVEVEHKTF